MPLRTLIVDDEPIGRLVLRQELDLFEEILIVGEAESGAQAVSLIDSERPDLVFLDLEMPGMSGFEVVKQIGAGGKLPDFVPVFIIVTAYDRYAIQAFEAGAVDYVLKPVRPERLAAAIAKASRVLEKQGGPAQGLAALQNVATSGANGGSGKVVRRIVAKSGSEYLLLNTEEVLAFLAEGDLVWIVTGKKRLLATETLRSVQNRLQGTSFHRIHRKAIVNIDHIRKMSPMSSQRWLLTLSNNVEFIVSKRQSKNVRDILSW